MNLATLTKIALEDDTQCFRYKGWDVLAGLSGRKIYFSIWLSYDEESDASITVVNRSYVYTLEELRGEISETINDLDITAKAATQKALQYDLGHIDIIDLVEYNPLYTYTQKG